MCVTERSRVCVTPAGRGPPRLELSSSAAFVSSPPRPASDRGGATGGSDWSTRFDHNSMVYQYMACIQWRCIVPAHYTHSVIVVRPIRAPVAEPLPSDESTGGGGGGKHAVV